MLVQGRPGGPALVRFQAAPWHRATLNPVCPLVTPLTLLAAAAVLAALAAPLAPCRMRGVVGGCVASALLAAALLWTLPAGSGLAASLLCLAVGPVVTGQ